MADKRWVASGIEIKTFNEREELNEVLLDASDIGKAIEEFNVYSEGKQVPFNSETICIENGLVLPKDRDSLSVTLDDEDVRHLMYCEPVHEVPGLYSVIDTVVDLSDENLPEYDSTYYVAIDAVLLAETLKIPQEELVVVQQTLLDKENAILDVKDNTLEGNKKWYASGMEINNFEKYFDFEKGAECPFYQFGSFAKRIVSTQDETLLKDMFINSGLIMPEGKNELKFFIKNNELAHTITCKPVENASGLYRAVDIVKDLRPDSDFENRNEYYVAINAKRLAKYLEIPDKELKVTKESLVDVHNKVIDVRDKQAPKIRSYISLKPKKEKDLSKNPKGKDDNSFEK